MEKSIFITDQMIARLRRNTAQEPWAKQAAQQLVERAAPWRAKSDEELWNLMFGPTIRRSWKVNANGVCPACQAPVPMYTWRIDAEKAPWKVTCPHCAERFPKNDFAAFYRSGLDKHGVFAPEMADRSLLFNVEHPDSKDPLHQFGVDDGSGYRAGEQSWYFIGAYLIYGPWKQQIIPGIEVLAAAYMVTSEAVYAHKAAILLDRVADLYPDFDYGTQSTQVPKGAGYVSTWHDACRETAVMVEAYDVIRGALPELSELTAFLSAQARRYHLENPKTQWTDIQRNIEDRILRDAMRNSHKVASNYPRGEINQNIIRAVLGEQNGPAVAQARLDAIIERATRVDGITGEKGLAAYSAYTIWTLASYLAQLSRRDPAFLPTLLKRHPILRQTYRFHIDTWCLQRYYPNEGDGTDFADIVTLWDPKRKPAYAGIAFSREPGVEASTFTFLMELYRATGDAAYAQVAYHANNRATENLPYDLFAENPAAMRQEIEKVIAAEGPVIKLKSINKEQWCLAILRSGAGDHERALWLDYDIGGGAHAHADGLNLGLFAYGLDLLPDCGYPQIQYSGTEAIKAGWFQRTASHNTVVVDGRNRGQTLSRGKTTLWADGSVLRGIRAGFDDQPYPLTWAYGRHYGHIALYSYSGGRFGKVRVWTRPNSSEPWQLQFSDDFQRTELGPDWDDADGAWRIENGQVVGKGTLLCKRILPGQHRLEYEAVADGAEVCDLSAYLGWEGESTGCFFGFGSQRNAGSKILVRDIVAATSDTRIVPGQLHRVTCLCEDRLQLIVDGVVCAQCDHLPNRSFEFIFGDATGKKQFERTVASIDVSPENFYVVDIFRVQGGTDHARFFHSYFGTVTTSGLALKPGAEYEHPVLLRNYHTDSAAQPGWQVDWTIEDRLKLLPPGTKVRLRHTDLTTEAEATVAESWVNVGNFNAKDEVWIPTLITRRRGAAPLASTFVEIIEPYSGSSSIKSTRRLSLQTADGKLCPDNCVAIEVELADGRRDLIISISRADGTVTQPDWKVRTDGELCLIRRDAVGRTIHAMLCKGRVLEAANYRSRTKYLSIASNVVPYNKLFNFLGTLMNAICKNFSPRWRNLPQQVAAFLLVPGLLIISNASALTVTTVTSGNGHPAHEVQWTDSAGQSRTAIMVDQSASGPGYLYQLTYQYNGSSRVCAGTGITGYPGDGFVQNHTVTGGDYNSLDQSTPGTTTILLQGNSHAIIEYSMPTYKISGQTIPTTICWIFADGRSHPIFAISQDARATSGNLGADTRSPYGSINFDGTSNGSSDIGGASYGDTLKFVTRAASPEEVTGLSAWSDNQTNTIPYAMEWINPAEVDAEMGHVATVPITIQDQGADRDANATLDPRNTQALSGPMIPYGASDVGPDAWAFQLLDYILHPDYSGDTQGAGASIQASYTKLAWGGNFGRVGGYNNGNGALNSTQYSQHYNCGANILTGTRVDGLLSTYSVFVVLGAHNGSYTNGSVGQEVIQIQNVTLANLAASIGTVTTNGPKGVGSAASATVTYSPGGYNPIYAAWEISAAGNGINATLTPGTSAPLDHPVFIVDNYTTNQLPGSITVGAGLTNAGVNYFASVDTTGQRLWITVNRVVSNALNLVVSGSGGGGGGSTPVISAFPAMAQLGATIIITGTNFTGATAVTFNGVAASFTINSTTQITATVPALATSGPITVTTPGGTAQSATIFTVQAATASLVIYDNNNGLVNGFQDYSWADSDNVYNTSPVYSGSYSISVTASTYTALSLYHDAFNTAPYASLSFWINGGASGARGLQVMGVTNQNFAIIYNLPPLAPNTWAQFNIPLAALGVASTTNCQGFWIWPTNSTVTSFFIDSIQLNTATAPAITADSIQPGSGLFVLHLSGFSGQPYYIETSTNLVNWTPVSTNTLTYSTLTITNAVMSGFSHQFWRAH